MIYYILLIILYNRCYLPIVGYKEVVAVLKKKQIHLDF